MADYMATAKKLLEDQTKKVNEDAQKAIDETNKQTDERIASAEASTQELLKQTDEDYIDAINAADLQKELDLRNIRETRANMGLSRSGLSSTEQTAAILSAGNKTAAAQRQRQAAIDTLKKSLADYKIQQEDSRRSGILSIEQSANDSIAKYGQKVYADAYDAQVAETKELNDANEEAEKNRLSLLKDMLDSNEIDRNLHLYAVQNKLSPQTALNIAKDVEPAKKILGDTPTWASKFRTLDYLYRSLDDVGVALVGEMIGLTAYDVEEYNKRKSLLDKTKDIWDKILKLEK